MNSNHNPKTDPQSAGSQIGEILFSAEEIQARIEQLGKQITTDYADKEPLLIGVLKGSFIFLSDLARSIDLPIEFDFIGVSSYGKSTKTSGTVRITKDLESDIAGKDVILVEDIIDSGLTFDYLYRLLDARKPRSITICCLLLSNGSHPPPDYFGFRITRSEPVFVVGYGLDAKEKYRQLPNIHEYLEK